MSSHPSPPVWFLLLDSVTGKPYKGTTADKVAVSSSADVADFRKAVKAEFADSHLKGIAASDLLVYKNKAAFDKRNALKEKEEPLKEFQDAVKTKYDQSSYLKDIPAGALHVYKNKDAFDKRNLVVDEEKEEPLEEDSLLDGLGMSKKEAVVVAVPLSTSSSLKPFRQKRYKTMSVEASCRKYLDAIALKLSSFYSFSFQYKSGPTIGDVITAKDGREGDDWCFHIAPKSYQQIGDDGFISQIRKGQPLTNIKLPDIYTTEEWKKIKKFNFNTSDRIHSANLPTLSNGRPYIVIPHAEFTPEMISFLKIIGVKASLFSSPDVLEIKDEDVLSEGSSIME